jgi:hypothetical protein
MGPRRGSDRFALGAESIFETGDDPSNSDIDAFSQQSHSESAGGNRASKKKDKNDNKRTAVDQARVISRAKLAVLVILVVSATFVSVAAYTFTRKEEVSDFEDAVSIWPHCLS